MSLAGAGFLVVVALPLAHRTGGLGALAITLLGAGATVLLSLRPLVVLRRALLERRSTDGEFWRPARRWTWSIAKGVVLGVGVWNVVSFASYVARDNGDTAAQRMTAWARDHGLGEVIDYLETQVYDEPPSKEPARDLSLAPSVSAVSTTTSSVPTVTVPASTTTEPEPVPQAPAALRTYFDPPLGGEGQWQAIASAGGHAALWATSVRPYPEAGGVVASMVVIDQTYLRAGMFNGSEEPGGEWARDDHVPPELYASLVAAMNGGFRFEHVKGGYVTEGTVVKPLRQGDATLAVGRDGVLVLGELGRDIFDDGSWASLRQNLVLLLDDGESQVARGVADGVWWGADYGSNVYVNRSAVCELADGRLAYLMVGPVDIDQLAASLQNVGCETAMQLDINGTWPNFFTFEHLPDGGVKPHFLDRRMGTNTYRYIKSSTKEFFAFFDATIVPSPSVLDV